MFSHPGVGKCDVDVLLFPGGRLPPHCVCKPSRFPWLSYHDFRREPLPVIRAFCGACGRLPPPALSAALCRVQQGSCASAEVGKTMLQRQEKKQCEGETVQYLEKEV